MQRLLALNSRKIKEITEMIMERWGTDFDLSGKALYMSSKDKIYMVSDMVGSIDMAKLRVNNLGVYLGELSKGELRLSIEGSQIIGKTASKNMIELDEDESDMWMNGEDLVVDSVLHGFYIIKNKKDILGCGRAVSGRLINYVPKTRRV